MSAKNISLSKAEPAQGLSMLEHIACTRQCLQKADAPWPDDFNLYVSATVWLKSHRRLVQFLCKDVLTAEKTLACHEYSWHRDPTA